MTKTPESLPNPLLDSLVRDALQAWNTSIVESSNDFDRMKSTLTAIMPRLLLQPDNETAALAAAKTKELKLNRRYKKLMRRCSQLNNALIKARTTKPVDATAVPSHVIDALQASLTFIEGFADDEMQEGIPTLTLKLKNALSADPALGETAAAHDVLAERRRQIEEEGFKPEEYDTTGVLSAAAAAYAFNASLLNYYKRGSPLAFWPWAKSWWKPTTPRHDLVKAGALILAEIERLDRASPRSEAER